MNVDRRTSLTVAATAAEGFAKPGDALLHCHQQLHMDYGFMQIEKYEA